MRSEARLDCATFQLDEARTRCELWVAAGNETEKLASGSLKPFLSHLKAAQEQIALGQTSITLQVPSNAQTLWFTKGTIERFVRFVTTPDVLERVSIVETERRQLEEAINILAVGDQQHSAGAAGTEVQDLIDDDAAGDSSKSQLLVAMDARRIMLDKEQLNAFARAAAAGFYVGCMTDLIDFSQYFGASRFREACVKFGTVYKKMQEKGQLSDLEVDIVADAGEDKNIKSRRTWAAQGNSPFESFPEPLETIDDVLKAAPASHGFRTIPDSPPNVTSPSQQETPPSRRLPRRVSSPRRRSCSPMRKVQIARSGSRRQGMVVIRNINYASPGSGKHAQPATMNDSNTEESDSVMEMESEDNKEENHRRLSVQDAISLFERKQRDSLESQSSKGERRGSVETGKTVLRRWSSIGDSSTVGEEEGEDFGEPASISATKEIGTSGGDHRQPASQEQHPMTSQEDLSSIPRIEERRKSWVTAQKDLEWKFQQLKLQEAALPAARSSKDLVQGTPPPQATAANMQFGFQYRAEKSSRGAVSRSWSASSEQDLVSIVRQAGMTAAAEGPSNQGNQREHGRLYEQYRERRDAKIRQESGLKKAERESRLKAMQEILDKRKAELVAGGGRSSEKFNERQVVKSTSSRKAMLQGGRTTTASRSSPTVSSLQSTPRATRQQLPPEPRPRAARKLSPGPQKPVSGPSARNSTSSPKLPRSTVASSQRRPSGMSDNPLSRSMPSLSELRKENTRPSVRTPQAVQQSKVAPAKNSKIPGMNSTRPKSASKVLPLESNGVVPSDFKSDTPPKRKTLFTTSNADSQILTPLKLLQAQQALSRIPTPKQVTTLQETKTFLRKGRGIGPGAGPVVMKLKVASASDAEEEDKPEEGDLSEGRDISLPSTDLHAEPSNFGAPPLAPDKPEEVPGSVRESQEMDIDTSSVEGDQKADTDICVDATCPDDTVPASDPPPLRTEIHGAVDLEVPMEWGVTDLQANIDSKAKLTLIQHIATENYVSYEDRGMAPLPAIGVPVLRQATSPDLNGVKVQRKKWGSSQQKTIPVVTVQQQGSKEGPKGFKRLLKFGRKSRGSGSSNTAEWVSASTTSEGDEDSDVSRDTSAGYGNGSSFIRRSIEAYSKEPDHTAGSRSFFSLSNFRSKGSDSKSR
ncbi:COP1-interacting protein 7 isoform X1 [Selaginella moellendorffii]|nr:COP1-interacting protein 7 isoform X1 [Selaginella moellendorffii]|eukprot:XP_002972648.2 COP1-interacting protein 7 isoform X1 [Selaginella moellendorffii]